MRRLGNGRGMYLRGALALRMAIPARTYTCESQLSQYQTGKMGDTIRMTCAMFLEPASTALNGG